MEAAFSIFDQMLEGVQVIGNDGRYLYANDAVLAQGKKARHELVGHTMPECYPGIEGTPLFHRIQECIKKKKSQELVNEFDFPDGSRGFFQLKMLPVESGVLIMSFDITRQKKAEEFLIDAKTYLEEMVRTRTEELESQNLIIERQLQHLKDLNETKDKFFRIVSHDLISPLQSLKGLTGLMTSGALTPSEFSENMDALHRSVQHTLRLAQNLITWANTQMNSHRKINMEKIRVSDLIHEVYGQYRELAERKGIDLNYRADTSLIAMADKNQLSFVVRNLVNNAIKYTSPAGQVSVTADPHGHDKVMIAVADNGIGISNQILERIRTMGVQQSTTGTHGEKGTGLGLLLCYEFIRQNNGHIEIESEVGLGSTFSVYLRNRQDVEQNS